MAERIQLKTELFWMKETTTCGDCTICEDMIISDQYQTVVYIHSIGFKEVHGPVCEDCMLGVNKTQNLEIL